MLGSAVEACRKEGEWRGKYRGKYRYFT